MKRALKCRHEKPSPSTLSQRKYGKSYLVYAYDRCFGANRFNFVHKLVDCDCCSAFEVLYGSSGVLPSHQPKMHPLAVLSASAEAARGPWFALIQ